MSAFSNYLEENLLNWLFRGAAFTPPDPVYISLHEADPAETGGNEVSTTNWTNYARIPLQTDSVATEWTAATASGIGYLTDNTVAVNFGTASTTGDRTITHVGIWDALTAGNFLFGGALTASKIVQNGDPVQFPIGDLDVKLE